MESNKQITPFSSYINKDDTSYFTRLFCSPNVLENDFKTIKCYINAKIYYMAYSGKVVLNVVKKVND